MKTTGKIGYRSSRQEGISLFVVLIILLLTMLVALWASRTALFSEMVTANDADYQRALERAQALVTDARADIMRGACLPGLNYDSVDENGDQIRCREQGYSGGNIYYPEDETGYLEMYAFSNLVTTGSNPPPSCRNGVCFPDNVPDLFWTKNNFGGMNSSASSYGQYTGRTRGYLGQAGTGSYWVEILKYDTTRAVAGGRATSFAPTADRPFAYRITAVGRGARASTQAVVQSIFVWRVP